MSLPFYPIERALLVSTPSWVIHDTSTFAPPTEAPCHARAATVWAPQQRGGDGVVFKPLQLQVGVQLKPLFGWNKINRKHKGGTMPRFRTPGGVLETNARYLARPSKIWAWLFLNSNLFYISTLGLGSWLNKWHLPLCLGSWCFAIDNQISMLLCWVTNQWPRQPKSASAIDTNSFLFRAASCCIPGIVHRPVHLA